jgi:phage gp36-like protein
VPAAYLSVPEFDAALTGDLLERASMAQKVGAVERATADADSYLRAGGYVTPVIAPPDDLRGRIADMARYRLAVMLRLLPEPASTSSLWIEHQAAIAWLREVAAGTLPLDAPLAGSAPGTASIYSTPSRRWDRGPR